MTENEDLTPQEIVTMIEEVIGPGSAVRWYDSHLVSLGGKRPRDLAQTKEGRAKIKTLLQQIEWGLYS